MFKLAIFLQIYHFCKTDTFLLSFSSLSMQSITPAATSWRSSCDGDYHWHRYWYWQKLQHRMKLEWWGRWPWQELWNSFWIGQFCADQCRASLFAEDLYSYNADQHYVVVEKYRLKNQNDQIMMICPPARTWSPEAYLGQRSNSFEPPCQCSQAWIHMRIIISMATMMIM